LIRRTLRDPSRRANAIDRDLLAEEIEGLGKSRHRACESALEQIREHLLKIAYVQVGQPQRH
jgi:hypothetical protein